MSRKIKGQCVAALLGGILVAFPQNLMAAEASINLQYLATEDSLVVFVVSKEDLSADGLLTLYYGDKLSFVEDESSMQEGGEYYSLSDDGLGELQIAYLASEDIEAKEVLELVFQVEEACDFSEVYLAGTLYTLDGQEVTLDKVMAQEIKEDWGQVPEQPTTPDDTEQAGEGEADRQGSPVEFVEYVVKQVTVLVKQVVSSIKNFVNSIFSKWGWR